MHHTDDQNLHCITSSLDLTNAENSMEHVENILRWKAKLYSSLH